MNGCATSIAARVGRDAKRVALPSRTANGVGAGLGAAAGSTGEGAAGDGVQALSGAVGRRLTREMKTEDEGRRAQVPGEIEEGIRAGT